MRNGLTGTQWSYNYVSRRINHGQQTPVFIALQTVNAIWAYRHLVVFNYKFNRSLCFPGTIAVFGGETKSHAIAQRDSWSRLLQFLRQRLTTDHTPNAFTADGPPTAITSKL